MCICNYVCTCVFMYVRLCVCLFMCVCVYFFVYMCACVQGCIPCGKNVGNVMIMTIGISKFLVVEGQASEENYRPIGHVSHLGACFSRKLIFVTPSNITAVLF